MWGSELFFKRRCTTRGDDGGAQAIVRGGARCVSQVLHRCAQPVSRGAARCASQVNDRGAHADAEAPRMYLIVVYRPFPAAPLVVRCMYMAVVPGPMPAAVVSRCCRRRLQQLVAPAARSAKTDACGRSFAVVSTQVSTVGLRLG